MTQYFSTPLAIFLTLLAAGMWGSWMQVVKLKKDYPISGIAFMLYMFSFVLVWAITLVLSPVLLPEGLIVAISQHTDVMWEIMIGGAMMSIGLLISLSIMNDLGLMLATTLSGAVTSILGIITSISKEGLPDDPKALPLIVMTSVIFLLASYVCNRASQMCSMDQAAAEGTVNGDKPRGKVSFKVIALILLDCILMNGWASGTASGTAAGIQPILTCAFMVTGSAISMLVAGMIIFTRNRQWKTVLCIGSSKKPLLLSAISAVCHYGGNVLSIYAMPAISATLSFLFGKTSSIWTYSWGFYYKEFQGAKKKTMVVLFAGLALYFAGLALLFFYNFG
ncbi:MAG: hypothetical protein GX096_08545 [Clostridiales bacterium]|nr:hypothetical protein [Clostridiales bacterium]